MNSIYIILCMLGILLIIIFLRYALPLAAKIFDEEEFAFERKNIGNLGSVFLKIFSIFALFLFIFLLVLEIEYLVGFPFSSQADALRAIIIPYIISFVLPLIIFCVLTPLKTKKLAESGNKVAGYLSYKINPRFNLFRLQAAFLLVSITMLVSIFFILPTLSPNYVVRQDTGKAVTFLVCLIFLFFVIGYLDVILYYIMKKVLGKYLNIDYSLPIYKAKKLGITEDNFYKTMFTKGQLKLLKKEMKNG